MTVFTGATVKLCGSRRGTFDKLFRFPHHDRMPDAVAPPLKTVSPIEPVQPPLPARMIRHRKQMNRLAHPARDSFQMRQRLTTDAAARHGSLQPDQKDFVWFDDGGNVHTIVSA